MFKCIWISDGVVGIKRGEIFFKDINKEWFTKEDGKRFRLTFGEFKYGVDFIKIEEK